MNRAFLLNFAIIALSLILSACSGGDSPVSPESCTEKKAKNHISSGHTLLWGFYDVFINVKTGEATAVPNRTVMIRANMNNLMEASGTKNLKLENLDLSKYNSEGRLSLDVGLQHPFPGLYKYTGFDVWGIFMHNGSGTLSYDGLTYPIAGTDAILENADGYTRWFNMLEFTAPKIIGYTPGKAGTPGFGPTANLNGYRIFADGLGKNDDIFEYLNNQNYYGRLHFKPGSVNYRRYNLLFPMVGGSPELKFQYAVHASWEPSDPVPPINIPKDFPISANVAEAFAIKCEVTEVPWFSSPSNWGGKLQIHATIYDWQGMEVDANWCDPGGIPHQIKDIKIAGNFLPNTWDGNYSFVGGDQFSSVVQIEIDSSLMNLKSKDGNELFIIVENVDPTDYSNNGLIPSGHFPEGALAAFVRANFICKDEPVQSNLKLKDITPPGWPALLRDVWVVNNKAYCVGGPGGLIIFDVSGSGNPVYMGGLYLGGEGNEIQVEGNYAYIADGSGGLKTVNISDPYKPVLVNTQVGTSAEGLYVLSGYCHLADGKGGYKIFDIGGGSVGGAPDNPKLQGTFSVSYAALDVFAVGGIAYVSDLETAFLTVDIGGGTQGGTPSNPKLEGSLSSVKVGNEITVLSGYAYVADNYGSTTRIATIDVNYPAFPTLVNSQSVSGYIWDLWINNNYLYAACDTVGLRIYQLALAEPPYPMYISTYDTDGNAFGVYKTGNFAYVADYLYGLLKVNVSTPASPKFEGRYFTPHDPYDVQVVNDYVYVADGGTGVTVVDVGGGGASPKQPLTVGNWKSSMNDIRGVWVENGYAYAGGGWFNKRFYVLDVGASIGSPSNPVGIANIAFSTYQGVLGVQKMGKYVYATAWEDGLKVFDVDGGVLGGSPSNPKYVTTIPTNCSWGLWAENGWIYMADGHNVQSRFYVFDAGGGTGSPNSPTIADSEITPQHNYDVQVVGEYAYVCGGNGLVVWDVVPQNNIQQVGSYVIAYPTLSRGLCVFAGYAFIVTSSGDIYAIDIGGGQAGGTPTSPKYVDSIKLPGDCFDVWVNKKHAYVASHHGGLRIVQIWE